jgi:hypothetical protein
MHICTHKGAETVLFLHRDDAEREAERTQTFFFFFFNSLDSFLDMGIMVSRRNSAVARGHQIEPLRCSDIVLPFV